MNTMKINLSQQKFDYFYMKSSALRIRIHKICSGFTLLELMFVTFIISIITIIALPAYFDYQSKARISESIQLLSPIRRAVEDFYYVNARFPDNHAEAGLPLPVAYETDNVTSLAIQEPVMPEQGEGKILVTLKVPNVGGTEYAFVPNFDSSGSFQWDCNVTDAIIADPINARFLPASCN